MPVSFRTFPVALLTAVVPIVLERLPLISKLHLIIKGYLKSSLLNFWLHMLEQVDFLVFPLFHSINNNNTTYIYINVLD